jgi:hypothetical protein
MNLLIYLLIYLFIDNNLLNKNIIFNNKINNIKINVCNNIHLNRSPIDNNLNLFYKNNNTIENCQCIYTYKIKPEISLYKILIYTSNKIIIFFGINLIVFILLKIQDIKKKNLIFNQITMRISHDTNFDECSICYNTYKFNTKICKIIKCNHIYHEDCIKEWIIEYNNRTCPLCRSII